MIRKLLNKFYIKVYENGKFLSQKRKYEAFRVKYNVDNGFKFNGDDILLYGNGKIQLGENSYIGELSTILAFEGTQVVIGRNCSISHNVRIYTQSRVPDQDFSRTKEVKTGDVVIEDNVWIGANVFINPGVIIKENSIIGANSVITKNVERFTIVGGVPAKLIRKKEGF